MAMDPVTITKEIETAASDAYARCRTGSAAGRGSLAGWTPCPLCSSLQSNYFVTMLTDGSTIGDGYNFNDDCISTIISTLPKPTKSVKLFSHGRGLAAHLHAVHTPWNPGKAELKRRKALQKRIENEQRRRRRSCSKKDDQTTNDKDSDGQERCKKRPKLAHEDEVSGTSQIINTRKEKWEPTEEESKQWSQRVMEIVALVESEAKKKESVAAGIDDETTSAIDANHSQQNIDDDTKGRDRSGNVCLSYRKSLPPFLAAASNGDLCALRKCIDDGGTGVNKMRVDERIPPLEPKRREHVKKLLSLLDRNGSIAEHWSAGGGHLECVSYLLDLRDMVCGESNETAPSTENAQHTSKKVRRRRDGKTSLHYAARNGHNAIIDLLLSRHDAPPVDIPSGDGTTPLQMACYGGHPSTVQHLVETHQANVFALNEWECCSSHWVAMSIGNEGKDKVIELCEYLKKRGVDFVKRQKQGHSPLHKAASRKNRHVIEWLAKESYFSDEERKSMGLPDIGDNRPSDIWLSVGGEKEFGLWMKDVCGW